MAKPSKSRFITGNDISSIRLDVGLTAHKIIDYDRRAMRRALAFGAAAIRKEARLLVSRRAIVSAPGEAPARQSGKLMKSIGTVSKGTGGGWVKVAPRTFSKAGLAPGLFYPAVLYYGSAKRSIEKRSNYMQTALQNKTENVRGAIQSALRDALVPR
jgi:hypothetical protein